MVKKQSATAFVAGIYGQSFYTKLGAVTLLAAVTSAGQFLLTWYLGNIIDAIGSGLQAVLVNFSIISGAVAVYVAGNAALGYAAGRMTSRFLFQLRVRMGNKLCSARYQDLEKSKDGDILSIVTNDVEGFRPWLATLFSLGHLPVKLLVVCGSVSFLNWKLSLFMLPMLPLAMIPSVLLSNKLHALTMQEREAVAGMTGFLTEIFHFMLVVKSFCLESLLLRKNRDLLKRVEQTRLRRTLREQVIQTFGRCFGHVINPVIFLFGGYLILHGELTVGQIISVMLLVNLVGEALNIVYAIPTSRQGARTTMERVNRILSLPDEEAGSMPVEAPTKEQTVFAMRRVGFAYEDKTVLNDVSLSIRAGEKIAVVGMSGSGKTTLFKLLCGLVKLQAGTLECFGRDTAELSAQALRQRLSVVTQESFLFPGTIWENLLLARPGADDAEIIAACRSACIHGFIVALPQGYDSRCGDMAIPLSKGQMQRINLARAFLRNAPVWLLDEPTSALDPATQQEVMDYILDGAQGKTVLMIAHGLTHPERFDRILVLSNGEVAGFGRHVELMQECPEYRLILDRSAVVEEEAV